MRGPPGATRREAVARGRTQAGGRGACKKNEENNVVQISIAGAVFRREEAKKRERRVCWGAWGPATAPVEQAICLLGVS